MRAIEVYFWIISYVILIALVIHAEISENKERKKRDKIMKDLDNLEISYLIELHK